ncbi:MAG: D-tyrosyl-tRNA(Tyr) deacylase [Candidatus Promineifilaceae bacterium]|jgi:D-tyrosyl-tRNA(Tyr) deacylase
MKALIQRVQHAAVVVDDETIGKIGQGFLILLGVTHADDASNAATLATKTANLRVFQDDDGKMNRSLCDVDGEALVISQFTLYADTRKGNRPSFVRAADPDLANALYEHYIAKLRNLLSQDRVSTGRFAADMKVSLLNDGPVTIELNTDH